MSELRQAKNSVTIEGILKENNLECKKDTEGKTYVAGDIVIQVAEGEEHKVSFFANEFTKEGKENKIFKGLMTVMNDFTSLAEALEVRGDASFADKVRVNRAQIGINDFVTDGQYTVVSNPKITASFVNRVTKNYDPKAVFELEMFFEGMKPEVKDDEETGNLIIKGLVPMYGGRIAPLEFIAKGEVAEYLEDNYEVKATGFVWGTIINRVIVTKTEKKGFGATKVDTVTRVERSFEITGGEEYQYDEDDTNAYNAKDIRTALAERQAYLAELVAKKKGEKGKSTATSTRSRGKSKVDEDDDLPF